jgi:hypothetical protein
MTANTQMLYWCGCNSKHISTCSTTTQACVSWSRGRSAVLKGGCMLTTKQQQGAPYRLSVWSAGHSVLRVKSPLPCCCICTRGLDSAECCCCHRWVAAVRCELDSCCCRWQPTHTYPHSSPGWRCQGWRHPCHIATRLRIAETKLPAACCSQNDLPAQQQSSRTLTWPAAATPSTPATLPNDESGLQRPDGAALELLLLYCTVSLIASHRRGQTQHLSVSLMLLSMNWSPSCAEKRQLNESRSCPCPLCQGLPYHCWCECYFDNCLSG